jgi:hypothetical protein
MKKIILNIVLLCTLFSSCTPRILQCYLSFKDINKTHEFTFSKQELKKRIIDSYTYDESLLAKNLGKTTIENLAVNTEYRKNIDVWLGKTTWDSFESEIRNNTSDTLSIIIGKHHSRKGIEMRAIVSGDENKSRITIQSFDYKRAKKCLREKNYYRIRLTNQIQKKFIDKLN